MQKKIDVSALNHNDLVKYMADHCGDENAWREFLHRFQNYIASIIIKECKRLHYNVCSDRIGDLLHNVYVRLLANDCRALQNFKGSYENSIIMWLRLIAVNIVRSDRNSAHNRQAWIEPGSKDDDIVKLLPDKTGQSEQEARELRSAIHISLDEIENERRCGTRDVLIFRYYFFERFEVDEIAGLPEICKLSEKRIRNIISEIKAKLRDCLANEGYG